MLVINAGHERIMDKLVVEEMRGLPHGWKHTRESIIQRVRGMRATDLVAAKRIREDIHCAHFFVHEPPYLITYVQGMECMLPFLPGEILPDALCFGGSDP